MYISGSTLRTSADFDNAMLFGLDISVWQQDELIDYGGQIIANTEDAVHINDGRFLKAVCSFKVR